MRIRKGLTVFVFFIALLTACGSEDRSQQAAGCLENVPGSISGLKVTGARSEKNVIQNVWPVICKARELYQDRLKTDPNLKGDLELKLAVEFNGEIGPYEVTRSTLNDPEFESQVIRLIQFMDFDPYGPHNSESEIILPIDFNP